MKAEKKVATIMHQYQHKKINCTRTQSRMTYGLTTHSRSWPSPLSPELHHLGWMTVARLLFGSSRWLCSMGKNVMQLIISSNSFITLSKIVLHRF